MLLLLGSYLLLVFALPVALSAVVSFRALPSGRRCPHCSGETLLLASRFLRMLGVLARGSRLERRWCVSCGWEGTARQTGMPSSPLRATGSAARRSRRELARRVTQTLDVRQLTIDGAAWRVMLQCWGNTGLYYGRLVFVAPSGRLWLDAVESFSGSDEHDVLGQALLLPEGLLANRLRRLVAEY